MKRRKVKGKTKLVQEGAGAAAGTPLAWKAGTNTADGTHIAARSDMERSVGASC